MSPLCFMPISHGSDERRQIYLSAHAFPFIFLISFFFVLSLITCRGSRLQLDLKANTSWESFSPSPSVGLRSMMREMEWVSYVLYLLILFRNETCSHGYSLYSKLTATPDWSLACPEPSKVGIAYTDTGTCDWCSVLVSRSLAWSQELRDLLLPPGWCRGFPPLRGSTPQHSLPLTDN